MIVKSLHFFLSALFVGKPKIVPSVEVFFGIALVLIKVQLKTGGVRDNA